MPAIRKILVPLDFSETSRTALRYAADLARHNGSSIHLLHVTPDPLRQPWAVEPGLAEFPRGLAERRDEAEVGLRALATEEGLDPLCTTVTVVDGIAHHEIVNYVEARAIDLIVMGTHGHGVIAHLLLGSVAERVIRHAPCPVLVVPKARRAKVPAGRAVTVAAAAGVPA